MILIKHFFSSLFQNSPNPTEVPRTSSTFPNHPKHPKTSLASHIFRLPGCSATLPLPGLHLLTGTLVGHIGVGDVSRHLLRTRTASSPDGPQLAPTGPALLDHQLAIKRHKMPWNTYKKWDKVLSQNGYNTPCWSSFSRYNYLEDSWRV